MATTANPPGLLSVPRITTLLSSLLVALGSGTNYVRGVYRRTKYENDIALTSSRSSPVSVVHIDSESRLADQNRFVRFSGLIVVQHMRLN